MQMDAPRAPSPGMHLVKLDMGSTQQWPRSMAQPFKGYRAKRDAGMAAIDKVMAMTDDGLLFGPVAASALVPPRLAAILVRKSLFLRHIPSGRTAYSRYTGIGIGRITSQQATGHCLHYPLPPPEGP